MGKFRLVKGFTLIAALMAVAFVFGCSSSSSTPEVSKKDSSTKITETYAAGQTVAMNTMGKGNATGYATLDIAEGTKVYLDEAGTEEYTGDIIYEMTYSDFDSEATFPGGSFNNVNLDGTIGTVTTEGFASVKVTDSDGNEIMMFDPPVSVGFSLREEALATRILDAATPAKAIAADCKIYKKRDADEFFTALLNCLIGFTDPCTVTITGNFVSLNAKNPNGTFAKICTLTGN